MSHALLMIDTDPDTGLISQAKITQLYNSQYAIINNNDAVASAEDHNMEDTEPNRIYLAINIDSLMCIRLQHVELPDPTDRYNPEW